MKRIITFLLVLVLLLGLSVTAFADKSPSGGDSSGKTTSRYPAASNGLTLYNSKDEEIGAVPAKDVKKIAVGNAKKLDESDKEAFLAAYEDAKKVEGKIVKYFYWLDIPEKYKTDDFAYAKYSFTCTGKNVEVTVNGNKMDVEQTGRYTYAAKLTEFGSVAILCD